jgi:predicted nucleic acid-binding protein
VEELNRQFSDLDLGFVDAAVIAISEFLNLPRIATVDRRHFVPLATAFELELLP